MTQQGRILKAPLWVGITVGVVGLVVVALAQNIANRHSIEDNLTRRSSLALEKAGITGAQVDFVGRDGSLVVTSTADIIRAEEIVGNLEGVRVVDVTGPDLPPRDPWITISVDGSTVRATGAVSSEALRAALTGRLGTQDGITVDPAVGDEGVAGLAGIVSALGTTSKGVSIVLNTGRITLSGSVESAAIHDATGAAAASAIGPGNVTDLLTVVPPPKEIQKALIALPPITFENDSAVLTAAGRAAVARAATILLANPAVVVRIEGHTDTTNSAEFNLALSRARSTTVLNSLVAAGVDRSRLSAFGFGETRLRVPDTTPQNRAINRRVEFIVQNP
ncbi:outer membrane protein OmpA-like peptidoglycan-associated protein [Allocatelliglobosispora scoriae]|uniref:Outer membrane protein OmpA-like peptidoglycan-associated protein n=1 Tax=Allocatelliglobosispora scoriae TaxID=643052 RepID=A0A841BFI0_9ACTN|nr:OmpA family protein [Allocatelliglobosispora scoriae]MBB5867847.1 outer membrane protein OmpA-like peptidoglycan-associated protein [Allocatelliglobosispora scoriae]